MLIIIQEVNIKVSKKEIDFCSLEIFSNSLFKQLQLNSVRSIDGCLYMTPTIIIFDFLRLTISIKVDSSSFFYRYLGHCDIYMIDD